MEALNGSGIVVTHTTETSLPLVRKEESEEAEKEDDDPASASISIDLKSKISGHPLYELFLGFHFDCLKACGVDIGELKGKNGKHMKQLQLVPDVPKTQEKELDQFMEAYCLVLAKMKEAIEEPHQNTMDFINNVHLQLKELTGCTSHPPESATGTDHVT